MHVQDLKIQRKNTCSAFMVEKVIGGKWVKEEGKLQETHWKQSSTNPN